MDFVKMERILDVALLILFILTMFYMFNLSAELILIPNIIVGSVLILYSILFVLWAITMKKIEIKDDSLVIY